ncbi:MAG: hypothetical protein H7235_00595, partial [Bdellovibrionaceae bacterium]|nr:hypothetical protein [Pseudobdellovibrionaceae bacterium]
CGKPNEKTGVSVSDLDVHVADVKADITQFEPVVWEKTNASRKEWSKMIYSVIENEEPTMLETNVATDIHTFCPRYDSLTQSERLNFWGQFFAALAHPESGWDAAQSTLEPLKYFKHVDPITNQRVRSEGLLQLSYQDEKSHHLNCGFNWNRDRYLAPEDPRKSILNPYLNLRCGIKIMSRQLKDKKSLTLAENVYWSVLRTSDHKEEIRDIANMTKSLKICQ